MTQPDPYQAPIGTPATRRRAFGVHVLTALGAGLALLALLEAVREHWAAMFGWLGAALVVDAADGPLARRLDVVRQLPDWSGETLDLVVDFVTYVFVPAYAIMASGLLLPMAAPLLGAAIAVTGALYFADRRMKTDDNHFRGFPTLWNVAAFYLFLLRPGPISASLLVLALLVLTFVPFNVMHPVRVTRLRSLNLVLVALWGILALMTVVQDFQVPVMVRVGLCVIAFYVLCSDIIIRIVVNR
ncbi:phosphatidylcholine synthase [Bradyrhizobium sp. 2TAF24]|uniref:phosphatidylcholine synthase n=1 Tax=Bradyrhizobium sp. 2TAF24 TaxID=3233011 RepID=UPI003F8EE86C